MRTGEQSGVKKTSLIRNIPSFLASMQSGCSFNSFATVNQHSEGIKQNSVPIDINPFITHPIHQFLTTPAGFTSPTLFEQQSVGSYTSHTDSQISEDSESAVRQGIRFFALIRED